MLGLFFCATASAQDHEEGRAPIVLDVVRDPTTWAPAALLYTSMRLDWSSSQPFFQNGFAERNARYTQSGRPNDWPLGYSEGNAKILKDSLAVLPASLANNAIAQLIERRLTDRFPGQRKLWKTLSWIERVAFASYVSYSLSAPHFQQWQLNKQLAKQYGFVQP
jgi:hypothetical protein